MAIRMPLIALALAAGGPALAEVTVVDDAVRLDPVTGGLHEARGDGVDAGYGDDNPVWRDGAVRLRAARNEVVAFQVLVGAPHRTGVRVRVGDLSGPTTLRAADVVRRFREWFVPVTRESEFCDDRIHRVSSLGLGWYPDALIPLDEGPLAAGFGEPFDVPDAHNAIPGQTAGAVWVDVLVPEGTRPGTYRGAVEVTSAEGREALPLELRVDDVTLPRENHAGVGSVSYSGLAFEVYRRRGAEALRPWFQLGHAHRFELDPLWLWPPADPRAGTVDWDAFRALWRPYVTGEAFTAEAGYWGPSPGAPVRRLVLPHDSNWPGPVAVDGLPADPDLWKRRLAEVVDLLSVPPFDRVEAHLFVNNLDEPRDEATYGLIAAYGRLIDDALGSRRGRVKFRLDAGYFKTVAEKVPGWDVARIFSEIGAFVDVWNENASARHVDAAATRARIAAHPDEEFWVYSSCTAGEPAIGSLALEGAALGPRTWGWVGYRYGLTGVVNWEWDRLQPSCWRSPDCVGERINGDSYLVYSGDFVGLHGRPVPSIRLKNLRRGAQDHEYLRLLAVVDGDAAAEVAASVVPRALDDGLVDDERPGAWSRDPRVWEAARHEIADRLAAPTDDRPPSADGAPPADGPPPADDTPADGGCATTGAAGPVWPALLLGLLLRRRRTAAARRTRALQ